VTEVLPRSTRFTLEPLPKLAECAMCFNVAVGMCLSCGRYFCLGHGLGSRCKECRELRLARACLFLVGVGLGVLTLVGGLTAQTPSQQVIVAVLAVASAVYLTLLVVAR
jgi:hypothetical protein